MKKYTTLFITSLLAAAVSTTAFADRANKFLSRMDTNDDGKISLEEFPTREGKMLKRMDADEDGAVSREELNQHLQDMEANMEERWTEAHAAIKEKFIAADSNQDGLVTADELRLETFNRADENGDGFLTAEELKSVGPDRGGRKGHRGGRKGHSDDME